MPDNDIFKLCHCRPKSKRCWRQVRRCEYRTYKTLCENVPIKTCDPKPVKECKEKCGTFYYCDNCPSVVGPPSPPPAGTFIVGPPAPPLSRTPRKTSKVLGKDGSLYHSQENLCMSYIRKSSETNLFRPGHGLREPSASRERAVDASLMFSHPEPQQAVLSPLSTLLPRSGHASSLLS